MVKKSKKSKSKRVTLKAQHKVLRKVKEHHRKKQKEARKDGKNHTSRVEKDPGIPNEWPFKERELKALEVRRAQAIKDLELKKEARKERARKRKLGLPEDEDIANLVAVASAQGSEFAEKDGAKEMPKTNVYSFPNLLKMAITVGIVGLPNVGKNSLINSLKRPHVVNVGSTPGVTRSMQEVQLDRKVKLLDCPGVVMLKFSNSGVSVALRNCKRVEKMEDVINPVKEILTLCLHEKMLSLYKMPDFTSVDDFLQKLATLRGKWKKGGIVDVEDAAKIVLHD